MKIIVLSKVDFEHFLKHNPLGVVINDKNVETFANHFFVSICNTHGVDSQSWFRFNHKNVLRLFFDDVLPGDPSIGPTVKLFDKTHARRLLEFIKSFNDSSIVSVHCRAGICRSAAVGF